MITFLVILVVALFTIACVAWWDRRQERRRQMIHRACFAPKIDILCHNHAAEAGSSATPGALSRSH